MGTIPDFDPEGYARAGPTESGLTELSLDHLAMLTESVRVKLAVAEAAHRAVRSKQVDGPAVNQASRELRQMQSLWATTRRVFARQLRARCGDRGYLVGTIVYRAHPDGLGFERTFLSNPPGEDLTP